MEITVACTHCNNIYRVHEQFLGTKVKCNRCGNIFIIEDQSGPTVPEGFDPFENAVYEGPRKKPIETAKPKRNATVETHALPRSAAEALISAEELAYRKSKQAGVRRGVGIGTLTPILLLLFVGFFAAFGVYGTVDAMHGGSKTDVDRISNLWGALGLTVVFTFVLMGPAVWGTLFSTSSILGIPLTSAPYIRACGVAGLMSVFFVLTGLLSVDAAIFIVLVGLAITFLAYRQIFQFTWIEASVGYGFALGAFTLASLAANFCTGKLLSTGYWQALQPRPSAVAGSAVASAAGGSNDNNVAGPSNAVATALDDLRYAVNRITIQDLAGASREEKLADVETLKAKLKAARALCDKEPEWPAIERQVGAFEQAVMALPSGKIDPAIYDFPGDVDDWTTGTLSRGKLAPEVTYRQYRIQTPLELRLDLKSSEESGTGLVWEAGRARMSIFTMPRPEVRQKRPLFSDAPVVMRLARQARLLVYDSTRQTATYGVINGLQFTRVASNPGEPGDRWVEYVAPVGPDWLVIRLVLPAAPPALPKVMEAAARTVRLADPSEAKINPFTPAQLASQLGDHYEEASRMLRERGPAAEDAVTAQLGNPDRLVRQRAAELLSDIGTAKSLPALQEAAKDPDGTVAAMARAAILKIQSK